jgi:hypothetical protein
MAINISIKDNIDVVLKAVKKILLGSWPGLFETMLEWSIEKML